MNAALPSDLCGIITAYSTPIYVCDYDKSIKLLQDICQTNKYDDKTRIHYSSSGAAYAIYEIISKISTDKLMYDITHNESIHNTFIEDIKHYKLYYKYIKLKKIELVNQRLYLYDGFFRSYDGFGYLYQYNQQYKCWLFTQLVYKNMNMYVSNAHSILIIEKVHGKPGKSGKPGTQRT